MEIIDISWPITPDITEYKNKKTVKFVRVKTFEVDQVRDSIISFGLHTGTHVDSPAHFLENGSSIDQVSLQKLVGDCRVLDFMHIDDHISFDDLEKCKIKKDEIVLLKTKNSLKSPTEEFDSSFIYLESSGANYLASITVRAVGIDYLGIERDQRNHETHKVLFEKNIPIIEGLRLKNIAEGNYFFCCLPLAMQDLAAAPARAILFKENFS